MGSVNWENVNLAGAFLIGSIFGMVVTLRVVRAVIDFFNGVERRRLARRAKENGKGDDA